MFRFTKKPSSGSDNQYLVKLQDWFSVDIDFVQTLSVLWRHSMTCVVCVVCTVIGYTLVLCTTHTPYRSYYAAITLKMSVRHLSIVQLDAQIIFNLFIYL